MSSQINQVEGKITLLWHTLYIDGPISGLCIYDGKKVFFTREKKTYKESKIFIYSLTEDERNELETIHSNNRLLFGNMNDYGELFGGMNSGSLPGGRFVKRYIYPSVNIPIGYINYDQINNPCQRDKIE